jgi:hypothetical protein
VLYTFAGDLQAKGLFGVHLGPPNLALMNSHHPHPMASSCTRVCYCRHLRLNPYVVLLTSPHPSPLHPNGRFFNPQFLMWPNWLSIFFFQFPDGPRLANIPRQIQTDFARLVTLFQETLETGASRHKCGDTLPNYLLRWFWMKNPLFFPL